MVSISAVAIFGRAFLRSTGIAENAPWLPLALVGWALVWLIASRAILTAARTLLLFEVVSVALILALDGDHRRQARLRRGACTVAG